jgi:hypothetical protein
MSRNQSHRRLDWEAGKRNQVFRLLRELRDETPSVKAVGHGAGARYVWRKGNGS